MMTGMIVRWLGRSVGVEAQGVLCLHGVDSNQDVSCLHSEACPIQGLGGWIRKHACFCRRVCGWHVIKKKKNLSNSTFEWGVHVC